MDSFRALFGPCSDQGVWTKNSLQERGLSFLKHVSVDTSRGVVEFEPTGYIGNFSLWQTLYATDPPFDFDVGFDAQRGAVCTYRIEQNRDDGISDEILVLLLCDAAYTLTLINGHTKMRNRIYRVGVNLPRGAAPAANEIRAIILRLNGAPFNNTTKGRGLI